MVTSSTLRIMRIAILVLSVAIPLLIGAYVYWQDKQVDESRDLMPAEVEEFVEIKLKAEEKEVVEMEMKIAEKEVLVDQEVKVLADVSKKVELPDEKLLEVLPSEEKPVIGRHQFHNLHSVDNRSVEVQILYLDEENVFIRRKDQKIFKVSLKSFHFDSIGIILEWNRRYSELVTPEQKAYIAGFDKQSIAAEEGLSRNSEYGGIRNERCLN